METLSGEIREVVDAYRTSNEAQRMGISRNVMERMFVYERTWKMIKAIDEVEERIKGGME